MKKSNAKIYQLLIQKMLPTTIEELESYMNKKTCYMCWEEFDYVSTKFQKMKEFYHFIWKYRDGAHLYNKDSADKFQNSGFKGSEIIYLFFSIDL